MEILRILPKNLLSRMTGELVSNEKPEWLVQKARDWFINRYDINMEEAELPLEHYPSIAKLFTRKLKEGIRPIGEGFVHPCDGRLTQVELIENGSLVQAKGKKYSINALLQDGKGQQEFLGGVALTYYLCPTDYHRVHSPVDAEISKVVHVPGALWPVNDWSVENITSLFTVNERVVFRMQTALGPVALVMVGATNVGKITVSFDPSIVTNTGRSRPLEKTYRPAHKINKGDEVGIFNMGSTVVLLYGKNMVNVLPQLNFVKLGESL